MIPTPLFLARFIWYRQKMSECSWTRIPRFLAISPCNLTRRTPVLSPVHKFLRRSSRCNGDTYGANHNLPEYSYGARLLHGNPRSSSGHPASLIGPQSLILPLQCLPLGLSLLALLEVQGLTTHYRILRGWVRAVENISFSVEQGEALGIAGESGSGKSTVALSLLRILPQGGYIRKGKITFQGQDLTSLPENEMRKIRC